MHGDVGITPGSRVKRLREIITEKGFVRIIEAHSGISALIGESVELRNGDEVLEYDGFWESSLTDSASKGLPDIEVISTDSRLHTINEIIEVTSKPIIVDGDTGRTSLEFEYLVRRLERLGVSAVIIEDKVFPKRNSLDTSARQTLEDPILFAEKIQRGKEATLTDEFMIIARLESLIAGTGLEDALARAEAYITAGVDGIMIHSQKDQVDEILAFADAYSNLCKNLGSRPLLVCVPTTYNLITDRELAENGFNIIIHANHLLRSGYKAMREAALSILENDRSFESEAICAPTREIFRAVGFDRITEQDRRDSAEQRLSVVIPAAGKDPVFTETPKSLIKVDGKAILDHQLESLRKAGLTNNKIVVVRGHKGNQFVRSDVKYVDNPRYLDTRSLHSLFCAEPELEDGFLLVYSDILFNDGLIRKLVDSGGDIVLMVDNSYRYHTHDVDKKLDLVVRGRQDTAHRRRLQPTSLVDISRIGKGIPKEIADYEFVGLAYFSQEGSETLRKVYADSKTLGDGPFHEADGFMKAQITDLIQETIDLGFRVQGLEVSMGWLEIHNPQDVSLAEQELFAAAP